MYGALSHCILLSKTLFGQKIDLLAQFSTRMPPCHVVYCFQTRYMTKKMIYLFAFQYVWRLLTLYIDFKHIIFRKVWKSCSLFYMPTIYIYCLQACHMTKSRLQACYMMKCRLQACYMMTCHTNTICFMEHRIKWEFASKTSPCAADASPT